MKNVSSLKWKTRVRESREEAELQNQERIGRLKEKEKCKCPAILEVASFKQTNMKEKVFKGVTEKKTSWKQTLQ